jgi:hypothetical protein
MQHARFLVPAVTYRPCALCSVLLPPIVAPMVYTPNPSLRYILVSVDWSLDVTPLLQVMLKSLHVAP